MPALSLSLSLALALSVKSLDSNFDINSEFTAPERARIPANGGECLFFSAWEIWNQRAVVEALSLAAAYNKSKIQGFYCVHV